MKSTRDALAAALPVGEVRTDDDFRLAVFTLARHLKAVPELRDKPPSELKPLVHEWYEQANGHLAGRDFEDAYGRFARCWSKVRFAAGDDAISRAWDIANREPPPPAAARYSPGVGKLVALCYGLQRVNEAAGRDHFALSGHVAADLLGVSQPTVSNWLAVLVEDGVLEITSPGGGFRGGKRVAREYRVVERPGPPAGEQPGDDPPGDDFPF